MVDLLRVWLSMWLKGLLRPCVVDVVIMIVGSLVDWGYK